MSSTFDQETGPEVPHYNPDMGIQTVEDERSRWPKVLLGVGLAGAIGVGAFLALSGDDDPAAAPEPTIIEEDDNTTTEGTDTQTTEPETETTSTEAPSTHEDTIEVHGLELAVPSGTSAREILADIAYNRTQIANFVDFSDYEEQAVFNEDFLAYVADPSTETGQQILENWESAQQLRQGDAFIEYDIAIVDPVMIEESADRMILSATLIDGSADPVRKTFVLSLGEIQTPNGPVPGWHIERETIE